MGHIKKNLKKIRFSVKAFAVLLFFVTGMVIINQSWRAKELVAYQEESIIRNMEEDLRLANLYVEQYAKSIRSFLAAVVTRNDILELQEWEAGRELNNLRKEEEYVTVLYVMGHDGDIMSSNQASFQVASTPIVWEMAERSKEMPYIVQYSKPYYSSMTASYSVFASYSVKDKLAVVETNSNYLNTNLQKVLGGKDKFYVMDAGGGDGLLFSRNEGAVPLKKGVYPMEVREDFSGVVERDWKPHVFYTAGEIPGYGFMYSAQNVLGWKIYSFLNHELLQGYKNQVWKSMLVTTGIWLFVVLITVFFITFFLTRPIRRLARDMDSVKNLDQLIEVGYGGEGEIARLSESYNHLILRIRTLVEDIRETEHKKMEYEFQMLQNQIGPHFLHNTLACIASLMRRGKAGQAQEALRALIKLLAYTFDGNGQPVTLKQEIEQLHNYVKIEKMRYGDCFEFEVSMDSQCEDKWIFKLTLQPLVENAIFHGIIPKGGTEGKLRLIVRSKREELHIFVCDNGVGMEPELCEKILSGGNSPRITDRLSSIGITNVNDRLKLRYGEKYGVRMRSRPGEGTIIFIRIPDKSSK